MLHPATEPVLGLWSFVFYESQFHVSVCEDMFLFGGVMFGGPKEGTIMLPLWTNDKLDYGSIMLLDELAFNGSSDLNRVAGGSLVEKPFLNFIVDTMN